MNGKYLEFGEMRRVALDAALDLSRQADVPLEPDALISAANLIFGFLIAEGSGTKS